MQADTCQLCHSRTAVASTDAHIVQRQLTHVLACDKCLQHAMSPNGVFDRIIANHPLFLKLSADRFHCVDARTPVEMQSSTISRVTDVIWWMMLVGCAVAIGAMAVYLMRTRKKPTMTMPKLSTLPVMAAAGQ